MLRRLAPSSACLARVCFAAILSLMLASLAWGQVQVVTEHNDIVRSGANTNETLLTHANVNMSLFGKLYSVPVDGDIVGQPLYMSGLHFPDGSTHNVVYVATQHDSVYAFDADTMAQLWTVNFINPAAGITTVPITMFGCPGVHFTEIGVMGTPVIDSAHSVIYLVAKTLENGAFNYRLHSLSLTTGADVTTAAVITASTTTNTGGTVQFMPQYGMQRPGLLFANNTVYVAFGSNGCDTYAYHGWLMAYNAQTLQQTAAMAITPNGTKGAIWQAGGGPAADTDGTIFLATANGTFDANIGGNDYGDSILHLSSGTNGFSVLDYFTPYNQAALASSDTDLGSGGVMLLPTQSGAHPHELVAGGKGMTVYLLDRAHLGGFNPAGDTQIVQSIVQASTGRIDSVPTYWNGNVYIAGNNDFIRAFSIANGALSPQPVMMTPNVFNISGPGVFSITSNSQMQNGILWALIHSTTAPTLYAFDAGNLSTLLYASNQAAVHRDALGGVPRFTSPTVANGHVYVGGTKTFMVYGLLPLLTPTSGNNQSPFVGTTITLQVQATNAYTQAILPNISVTCKDGGVGGKFAVATVATDSTGTATFSYTVPTKAKTVTINCASPGMATAVFNETAVEGPPSRINIPSGNNQTGPPSTALPLPFTVLVYDRYSRGVPGVTVTFSDNGAGGSFTATTAVTDATGHASTTYTTPAKTGTYTVTASVTGITPGTFHVTVQ